MPHLQKINSFQWHSTKIKRGNTCLDSQNSRLSSRLRLSENNTQKRRRRRYKTSHQYFSRVTMHYQMILVSLKYSTFENIYKFTKLSNNEYDINDCVHNRFFFRSAVSTIALMLLFFIWFISKTGIKKKNWKTVKVFCYKFDNKWKKKYFICLDSSTLEVNN